MSDERKDGIQDADLHAYLDGELDADRRLAVEAHLARHPSDRARLESWRAQQAALHHRFDAVLAEPLPAALGRLPAPPPRPRPWRLATMLVLAAVLAGGLGWVLGRHQAQPAPALAHLVAP
uniref:anti-sigma factor family protein n=1 Tax=Thiohalobacter sp. TaxID=2025948 RepID=UPI00261E6335